MNFFTRKKHSEVEEQTMPKSKIATSFDITLIKRRPKNYYKLPKQRRYDIDKNIGILNLDVNLTNKQRDELNRHFKTFK